MRIDEICCDLSQMKRTAKNMGITYVEFECPECKKLVKNKLVTFFRRKNLLCHQCIMKKINNDPEGLKKRGATRTESNKLKRASKEREEWLIKNEFEPKNLVIQSTFFDKENEKNYTLQCKLCNSTFVWNEYQRNSGKEITQHPYCKFCHKDLTSRKEYDLYEYIKSIYNKTILKNSREIIKPKEIDIYLPDLKLGFEFDGLHWHQGDTYNLYEKTKICNDAGITLVHILESDWQESTIDKTKKIVKDIINDSLCIDDVSFIRDDILYVDRRFTQKRLDKSFIKTTNPKKLYFWNKTIVDDTQEEYIYNCGYDTYALKDNFNVIEDQELEFYQNIEKTVTSRADLLQLPSYQFIKFICPKCHKEKHYRAITMQVADEFICGNCRQGLKMKGKKFH